MNKESGLIHAIRCSSCGDIWISGPRCLCQAGGRAILVKAWRYLLDQGPGSWVIEEIVAE